MELDIIDYLRSHFPKLKKDFYPIFTTELKRDSFVYFFRPISNDYVSESQLEIRIIAKDYDKAVELANKLDEVLAFKRDDPYKIFGNTKFRGVKTGGGCLFQDGVQRFEYTLFYAIKWRAING